MDEFVGNVSHSQSDYHRYQKATKGKYCVAPHGYTELCKKSFSMKLLFHFHFGFNTFTEFRNCTVASIIHEIPLRVFFLFFSKQREKR